MNESQLSSGQLAQAMFWKLSFTKLVSYLVALMSVSVDEIKHFRLINCKREIFAEKMLNHLIN